MRSENATDVRRLQPLSQLRGYDVDGREPDPRGWTVVGGDGRSVGEVKDLIVDTERMTAMYLDVELDARAFDLGREDPHVYIPVDRARRDGRRVVVDEITSDWVSELQLARERHREEFWDRWWNGSEASTDSTDEVPSRSGSKRDAVRRAIEDVQPGQEVRIPVINEEIVVERRPLEREEVITSRTVDEPRRR